MGNDGECKLLGDFFGAIIQVFLAVVCFASLLVKWQVISQFLSAQPGSALCVQLEKPKRSSEVFLLDSSKQGFSGVCAHVTGNTNRIPQQLIVATHSYIGEYHREFKDRSGQGKRVCMVLRSVYGRHDAGGI